MKRIFEVSALFVFAGLMNACGVATPSSANLNQVSPADDEVSSEVVEIDGTDADKLFAAIEGLGVEDTDRLIGATNLRIKNLRCDTDTSNPSRKIRCSYEAINAETGLLESHAGVQGKSSDDLFNILSKHGLNVNAGINPNYRAIAAKSLTCSLPVVPQPVAHCTAEKL